MLTLNDGRSELWQWDTGRTLSVDADCTQVHFSNKVFGRSVDVDVVDGVAIVPDILLQTDKELTAWAFVGTAENGYTKISKVFKVNKRNKPADYVFTPPEQTSLEEIKEKLDYLESIQDPDAIKNAVDDYLANNPIMVKETDPTVPEWAKQPTPPDVKIPDKLPNPHSITFTGAVDASYDGSNPVEIKIPDSGGNVDLTGYATEQWVKDQKYLTEVPAGYAKTEDIPTKPEDIGAQPKGEYLTAVPDGYATEEYVKNKIAEAELGGEEVDLSGYAQKSELPTKVSQLENDSGYLTEHQDISGKLDANKLPEAINTALAQAKASGEFDGKDGVDGKDGYTPVKGVDYFDGQPGKDGSDGKDGYTPKKGIDYFDGQQGPQGEQGLQGEQGEPGKDGANGKDGTSATHSWDGTVLTITSASGTSSADLKGAKGDQGEKGADGAKGDKGDKGDTGATGANGKDGTSVTVTSVSESTADGGSNVVTFSDGKTITIKNGSKGNKGDPGTTPQKGIDFWTPADQEAIVQQVITALGTPVFGRVDADNNIILTGELADGTYTLKYEDAEGEVTEIGELALGGITNLADPSSADWKANSRLNSSGSLVAAETYANGGAVTNFIPCKMGDVIRVKGLNISNYYANSQGTTGRTTAFFFAENKSTVIAKNVPADGNGWVYANGIWTYTVGTSLTAVSGSNSDIRYARLTGIYYSGYTANNVIITVNEEIV